VMLKELKQNPVLGNPIRLGIMLYLLPRRRALFAELQKVLDLTPGNLDSHLRTLERHGYVRVRKVLADRPRTAVFITEEGVENLREYLEVLKRALGGVEAER